MDKKLSSYAIETYLYENGFNNTVNYIYEQCKLRPQCLLITKNKIQESCDISKIQDVYKIMYVENGNFSIKIDNHYYELESGDVLLIPPYINYKLIKTTNVQLKIVMLLFREDYLASFNTETSDLLSVFKKVIDINNYNIKVRPTFKSRINYSVNMLEELFLSKEYGDDILFNAALISLITRMNKGINFTEVDQYFVTYSLIIKKINDYISENIDKKILIIDLANHVGLSESRISHIYKNQMGISINQYINKKRLTIAKDMLKIGASLTDVATKCGFQDYSSFLRSFKKAYDISPKAYQKQYYNE